jgi:phage shock protein A
MHDLEPIVAQPAVRIPRETDDRTEMTVRFAPLSGILSGPIFTRTRDIIAANMTELLDRSEDPARMIRVIINEMEETLVEVRATAARSIADIKEMRRACNRLDDLQYGWTEKAELALEKGREDLARAALGEKQKATEMAESLHAEVAQIEQVLRGYEADIARLQAKLAEARARQNAIASRFESAITAPAPAKCCTATAPRRRSPSSSCSSAAPTLPKAAPMRWRWPARRASRKRLPS